jgi:hypothetical protein
MRRLLPSLLLAVALAGCGGVHATLPIPLSLPPATGQVLVDKIGQGSRVISFTSPKHGAVTVSLVCKGAKKTKVVVGRYMRFAIFCNGPSSGGETSTAMPHGMRFAARITATAGTLWEVRIERVTHARR